MVYVCVCSVYMGSGDNLECRSSLMTWNQPPALCWPKASSYSHLQVQFRMTNASYHP